MKTHYKLVALACALALSTGGSFVLAQSSTPTVTSPPTGSSTSPRRGMMGGTYPGGMRGEHSGQPRMELALALLRDARAHLEAAEHDKGGFRDKAIASTDVAIHDVEEGIKYAREHPEEFPRGRGEGPRGTSTTVPPAGS